MVFSVVTKNLKWEILTKNSVTFKRWDWFLGGVPEKPIYRVELPKKGEGLDNFQI